MSENTRRSVGAVIGLGAGILAYWLVRQSGNFIFAAVGAGVALGVSAASRTRSVWWGVLTMILAVAVTLTTLLLFMSFRGEPTFSNFLTHVGGGMRGAWRMLLVVAALGFWFGLGRVRRRAEPA